MKLTKMHLIIGAGSLVLAIVSSTITAGIVLNLNQSARSSNETPDTSITENPSATPTQEETAQPTPTPKPEKTQSKPQKTLPMFECKNVSALDIRSYIFSWLRYPGEKWEYPSDVGGDFGGHAEYFSTLLLDYELTGEQKYQIQKTVGIFYEIKSMAENEYYFADSFIAEAEPKVMEALDWFIDGCD